MVCSTMCISHLLPPLGCVPIITDSFSSWKVSLRSPMQRFTSVFYAAQSKISPLGLLTSCCCSTESLFLPCFFPSTFLKETCLLFPARENGDHSSSPALKTGEYNIDGGLMSLKLLSLHACGSTSRSVPNPGVLGCLLGSSAEWKIGGELMKILRWSSSRWICSEVKEPPLLPAKRAQMFFNLHRQACRMQVSTMKLHVCNGKDPLFAKLPA